jgi:hypothetical protein
MTTQTNKLDVGAMTMTDTEMNTLVIQTARDVGLRVIIDSKMLNDNYTNVTGSFPSLVRFARSLLSIITPAVAQPIDMLLFCPECGTQHIDAPEEHERDEGLSVRMDVSWTNPPHKSHLCHACETVWRPADVPTNGVASIKTKGKADTWLAACPAAPAQSGEPIYQREHESGAWIDTTLLGYQCWPEERRRIVYAAPQPAQTAQSEPAAWRHSLTHCLYETEAEVPLADDDEWAVPLYLGAEPAQTERPPSFDAKHVRLRGIGAKILLTLELDAVEPAPRYTVTPVNPSVVRAAAQPASGDGGG